MDNVLVFVSIVIGVGVTDEMVSLHRLLRARHRVRWDWAVPLVALLVLLTIVQMWWTIAQPDAKSMTIGAFLPTLGELILLFLLASAVFPDEVPEEGLDLRTFYHDQGAYIWTLFAAALAWLIVTDIVVNYPKVGLARAVNSHIGDSIALALMTSLIFVRKRWWHAVGLLFLAGGPIGWLSRSLS